MANGKPGRPPGRTYTVKAYGYLEPETAAKLDELAQRLGYGGNTSAVVRHAIQELIRREEEAVPAA